MDATPEDLARCSIAASLALIGEKWSFLILRDVFHGVRRFEDFRTRLQCSPAVLSARLKTLTEAGLLRKIGYREPGARERFEYRPTRRAVELMPVLVGLMQWGDRHLGDDGPRPMEVRARSSGQRVRAVLVDEDDRLVPIEELRLVRTADGLASAREAPDTGDQVAARGDADTDTNAGPMPSPRPG